MIYRDYSKRLCIYTAASDLLWSGVVTQFPPQDLIKPHSEQSHQLLAFLSDFFNTTQLGWSVLQKEAYAVLVTLERVYWLETTPEGFDLYTNHNNLIPSSLSGFGFMADAFSKGATLGCASEHLQLNLFPNP